MQATANNMHTKPCIAYEPAEATTEGPVSCCIVIEVSSHVRKFEILIAYRGTAKEGSPPSS